MTGYSEEHPVPRSQPHHYETYIEYCPVCGRERKEMTRKPGKRVKTDNVTADFYAYYEFKEVYDWCDG